MKKQIILYSVFIVFLAAFALPLTQAQPTRIATEDAYSVTILDAYYVEQDIYSTVQVLAKTQSTSENYYLELTVVNPIGEEVTFLLRVMTHQELLTLHIVFYNTATVAGDYTILATIITNNRWYAETDIIVFDPPGGGTEGDPEIGITIG